MKTIIILILILITGITNAQVGIKSDFGSDAKIKFEKDLSGRKYSGFHTGLLLKAESKSAKDSTYNQYNFSENTASKDSINSTALITDNYYEFFSGKKVVYNRIQLIKKGNKIQYFVFDSTKVSANSVAFYNEGYYANIDNQPMLADRFQFAKKVRGGNIDIYQASENMFIAGPGVIGGFQDVKLSFYRKGDGKLKKLKYSNLKHDLKDNYESKKYLDNYQAAGIGQWAGLLTGAGIAAYGLTNDSGGETMEEESDNNMITTLTGVATGLVFYYIFKKKKEKNLRLAVDAYL